VDADLITTGGNFSAGALSSLDVTGNTTIADNMVLNNVTNSDFTGSTTISDLLRITGGAAPA